MNRLFKIIIAVALILSATDLAHAQTFTVKSINGGNSTIKISLDDKDLLKVSCLGDTIFIKDCYGFTDSVSVLNDRFLKIDYRERAGSGLDWILTDIFCIKNNKLIESLHVTSIFKEEFIDFRKKYDPKSGADVSSLYEAKLNMPASGYPDYKIDVHIQDKRKSNEDRDNYDRKTVTRLKFDPMRDIFYTGYINPPGYYTIFDSKTGTQKKEYLKGNLPIVELGGDTYYYIKNAWYEEQNKHYLYKLSYH